MGAGRTENGGEKEKQKPKISKEEQDRLDAIHASYASYFRQKYGTILKRLDGPTEEPEVPDDPSASVLTTMASRTKLLPDGVYVFSATPHNEAYRDKKGNARFSLLIQDGKVYPRPHLSMVDYLKDKSQFLKDFKEQTWASMAALATAQGEGSFNVDLPHISRPKPSAYDIDRLNAILEVANNSKFGIQLGANAQELIGMLPVETKRRLFSAKYGQQDYLGYVQQLNAQHQQSSGGRILSYGRQQDALSKEPDFDLNRFYRNEKGEEKFGAERLAGLSGALDKMESRLKSLDSLYSELDAEVDHYKRLIDEYETKVQNGEAGAEEKLAEALEGVEKVTERRDTLISAIEKESEKLGKGLDALEVEFSRDGTKYDPAKPAPDNATKEADNTRKGELQKRFTDMGSLKTKVFGELAPDAKMKDTKKKFEDITNKVNDLNDKQQKQQSSQRSP